MSIWEEGYKIGHSEMDAEHLILFSILTQLEANLNADIAGAGVADIVKAFDSYIEYHFAHEEALMKAWGYPDLAAHSAAHHEFVNNLTRLRGRTAADAPHKAALELRSFVLDWLLSHTLETDVKYANFIAERGKGR